MINRGMQRSAIHEARDLPQAPEEDEDEEEEEETTQTPLLSRLRSIPAKVQEAKPEKKDNNKTEKEGCPYSLPYLCKYLSWWSWRDEQNLIVFE